VLPASGISLSSYIPLHLQNVSHTSADSELFASLHAACLYWQFPDIAWMRLFPRVDPPGNSRPVGTRVGETQTVPSLTSLGAALVNALNAQW
jgi:hypothetical protein